MGSDEDDKIDEENTAGGSTAELIDLGGGQDAS